MRRWAIVAAIFVVLSAHAEAQTPAPAVSGGPTAESDRITVLEENDSLYFNSDKHYTQGTRLSDLLGGPPAPGGLWDDAYGLAGKAGIFRDGGRRRVAIFLGQSIFTPKNLTLKPPDPKDRPYAGWAYAGVSLLQDTGGRMLENLELDLGMVGPGTLAKLAQNNFHQYIGASQARGWSSQLQQEPGVMLSYERYWKLPIFGDERGFSMDVVPEVGATVGNIMTYGDVGGMLRIGTGLGADYGPVRVRPALSGTDYFDSSGLDDGDHGFYFYIGTQGRAVGRNIFLDGNTFRTSRSVPKKNFVGDAESGFTYLYSKSLRFDFSVAIRSEEFVGQKTPDEIGTAALTFNW
ncbi:MAG TPA: lipid A deacylase LpxR family protein [Stellaceae bacterium]|nr:lipid A deacylase LpxR family protein [Stellaceae bacterium]